MRSKKWMKVATVVVFVPIGVATNDGPVSAATIAVTTVNDENNGATGGRSLREAVIEANVTAAADLITLPAGTYLLDVCGPPDSNASTGDLDVLNPLTIRGASAATTIIEQTCDDRVFQVFGAISATFEHVTITGGDPASNGGDGGGIYAPSANVSVTVRDSIITGNAAGDSTGDARSGGGIYIDRTGTLLVERTTISNNTVGVGLTDATPVVGWKAGGGGIAMRGFNGEPGTVTIVDSVVSGNTGGVAARGGGGGLWLDTGLITITNTDIVGNTLASDPTGRAAGDGAGIAVMSAVNGAEFPLDLTFTGGSVSGNAVGAPVSANAAGFGVPGGHGGGLYLVESSSDFTGTVTIDGTVFDGNSAGDGGAMASGTGAGGDGGNIYITGYAAPSIGPINVTIIDAVIANGSAGSSPGGAGGNGGGVYIAVGSFDLGSAVNVSGTSFSGNMAGVGTTGGRGGGLVVQNTSDNTAGLTAIAGSTFAGNAAGDGLASIGANGGAGGGAWLYNTADAQPSPGVTVSGTTFDGNSAGSGSGIASGSAGFGGVGGGLWVLSANSSVNTSTFVENAAGDGGDGAPTARPGALGGGLYVSGGLTQVADSTFTSNTAGRGGNSATASGSSGGNGGGAAFAVSTSATITSSSFSGNAAGDGGTGPDGAAGGGSGGAISADLDAALLRIENSTITGNQSGAGGDSIDRAGAGGFGGGVYVRGQGTTTEFDGVTISGNAAGDAGSGTNALGAGGGSGGGVAVVDLGVDGTLTITESVIADNTTGVGGSAAGPGESSSFGGFGGGLWTGVGGDPGVSLDVTIRRSSITGNVTGDGGAPGDGGIAVTGGLGGGVYAVTGAGSFSLENSTIAGNKTGRAAGGGNAGDGGGLYLNDPSEPASLHHATLAGNTGGNGHNLATEVDVFATNTVIADPNPDGANQGENCNFGASSGSITSLGGNAEGEGNTCQFIAGTDLISLSDLLGPLQNNGGAGLTRVPRLFGPSSGALVDRIPANECGLAVDQRGVSRPQGAGCDVGAVEANPSVVAHDDVIRVGSSSVVDFTTNDVTSNATLDDAIVKIVRQPDDGTLLVNDGVWTFFAPQQAGSYTDFDYEVCLGVTDAYCDTATVTLIPEALSRFVSLPPSRLFDTRQNEPGNGPKGYVEAGQSIDVQITGVGGVPASGVSAVAMNVTATRVEGPGFVTAFPTGSPQPETSNLNFVSANETVPNLVIVPVGDGGRVTLYSLVGAHLIADVAGYFTEAGIGEIASSPGSKSGRLIPLTPSRVFDTRQLEAAPGPKGYVTADSTIDVQIAGQAGVPSSGVSAVVMNLTATAADRPGFVTAFPTGTARPTASNLNLTPGQTTPNLVIVPLGTGGKISLYSLGGVHLLGDVTGYITDGSAPRSLSGLFAPTAPERAFDTRAGQEPPGSKGYVDSGTTRAVKFTAKPGFPAHAGVPAAGAAAVMINATATAAAQPGFVTAWPDGVQQPTASTLNLSFAGQTRPNGAILPLGADGRIAFYSFGGTHLLADVFGWFLE